MKNERCGKKTENFYRTFVSIFKAEEEEVKEEKLFRVYYKRKSKFH